MMMMMMITQTSEFNPEQNYAGLESISQTIQKLYHFQMLAFINSRWWPAAKMTDGIFRRHLSDRFILSRGIFVPKGPSKNLTAFTSSSLGKWRGVGDMKNVEKNA
jgi:hypothetical protein